MALRSINVPTDNAAKAEPFYAYLVGSQLAPHALDASGGASKAHRVDSPVFLTIFPRHHREERTLCYFQVPSIEKAMHDLEGLGGHVLVRPFGLPVANRKASAAVMTDPDGNHVGLVEIDEAQT